MKSPFRHGLTLAGLVCAVICSLHPAVAQSTRPLGAGRSTGPATGFANRGAAACDKYLTAGVVGEILAGPPGKPRQVSPQSCSVASTDNAGTITITLVNSGAQNFDAYQKYLVNPTPLPGVGDRAVQSLIGIAAFKAPNMQCHIDTGGAPGSLKLRGAALGQKLGAICNQIFGPRGERRV
ncbi:MAG: hypothetical protein ACRELE_01990 [Gemmatimonadales bacterium]